MGSRTILTSSSTNANHSVRACSQSSCLALDIGNALLVRMRSTGRLSRRCFSKEDQVLQRDDADVHHRNFSHSLVALSVISSSGMSNRLQLARGFAVSFSASQCVNCCSMGRWSASRPGTICRLNPSSPASTSDTPQCPSSRPPRPPRSDSGIRSRCPRRYSSCFHRLLEGQLLPGAVPYVEYGQLGQLSMTTPANHFQSSPCGSGARRREPCRSCIEAPCTWLRSKEGRLLHRVRRPFIEHLPFLVHVL